LHGAGALLLGFQFGKSCLEFIVSRFSHAATSTLLFLDIQIVAGTSNLTNLRRSCVVFSLHSMVQNQS
jgi:hypothetical protein